MITVIIIGLITTAVYNRGMYVNATIMAYGCLWVKGTAIQNIQLLVYEASKPWAFKIIFPPKTVPTHMYNHGNTPQAKVYNITM